MKKFLFGLLMVNLVCGLSGYVGYDPAMMSAVLLPILAGPLLFVGVIGGGIIEYVFKKDYEYFAILIAMSLILTIVNLSIVFAAEFGNMVFNLGGIWIYAGIGTLLTIGYITCWTGVKLLPKSIK